MPWRQVLDHGRDERGRQERWSLTRKATRSPTWWKKLPAATTWLTLTRVRPDSSAIAGPASAGACRFASGSRTRLGRKRDVERCDRTGGAGT